MARLCCGEISRRAWRTQQQLVPFWYARFPELTADQIRNNALIHSGLGLAGNASESEEWMRCFGSMPRMANQIESDEVQALALRGMKRLRYSTCLALRLPQGGEQLGEWLRWVRGMPMRLTGAWGEATCAALVDKGVLCGVPRPAGRPAEFILANALTIAFGERLLTGKDGAVAPGESASPQTSLVWDTYHQAVFLAMSAAGLARFEAPNCPARALLDSMPYAYRMGMGARARINGDTGPSDPSAWRWHDNSEEPGVSEAVLLLYASSPERLARMEDLHGQLLANHGGKVLSRTDCAPAFADESRADFEHFGFRDGISQPVIAGTQRSLHGVPARDVLEPGEMILGYANAEGYLPPSPLLPVEADTRPESGEKGLLFATICADIERQFEFVQQFWANAPAFHGLEHEPDPIIGSDPVDPRNGCPVERVFTTPTSAGPIRIEGLQSFVQTMGGGYFFLPSRSAFGWLSDAALHSRPGKSGPSV